MRRMMAAAAALMALAMAADAAPLTYTELLARPRPAANQRIQYGLSPSQFGDLWLPAGAGPHRVVVLIHGGCWLAQLPGLDMTAYAAEDLRQHGIAVWNIEYRRLGEPGGGYPGSFEDVANAADWLRTLAKTYPLTLASVVALGHSAGGHFALWLAARPRIDKASPLFRNDPLRIKAVVTLAGIGDLKIYRDRGPHACGEPATIDQLVGAARRWPGDVFADTSPAALLPLGVPQAIISGALDPIVPAAFGRDYAAQAIAAKDKVEEITLPDAGHFELIDPKAKAFETIRAVIEKLQK
jgi:acetyl esterase/lipase